MFSLFDERRYLIPFRSQLLPHIFADTLVIGAGVAGMRAAIEAAADGGDVILLAKRELELSATGLAQGGIAAAVGPDDTTASHFDDTVAAGAGLCDHGAVRTLVDEAPAAIEELLEWGMRFDREPDGSFSRGREGGHAHHRILHTDGAETGLELMRTLATRVRADERIRVFEQCYALDLLTSDVNGSRGERVLGAITRHPRYGLQIIWARATVLASGGAGMVYRETTNPHVSTGDGLAMAYRAGAHVADVEFMQFHPTTLYVAGAGRALISEAVRGEGAYLVDRGGRRFMAEYHEMAELAPRDVVSQAIIDQLARTQGETVYLDVRQFAPGVFAARFPALDELVRSFDLDPETDLIPVHPSAHYTIGGVWTDLEGATNLQGLYACGEAACNGLHGANRLASNSLLEGLVYGRRAGRAAASIDSERTGPIKIISDIRPDEHAELDLEDVRSSLRSAMWRNVGVQRSGPKLTDVVDMFRFWARYTMTGIFDEPEAWEVQNLLTVGAIMSRAALWRCETRGVHLRLDHPEPRDAFRRHARWRVASDQPAPLAVDDPQPVASS